MAQQKNARTSKLSRRAENHGASAADMQGMRLDKWLWCARFYKTRALAVEEIDRGRVLVNTIVAKASREIRVDDELEIGHGPHRKTVRVLALSAMRGPASVAQQLYEETPESIAARERMAQLKALAPEPGEMLRHGRPTKKNRRDMEHLKGQWNGDASRPHGRGPLDTRWSAGQGPEP